MKRVVSVSLGSSDRDHKVRTNILGIDFEIERVGTDGSIEKMKELIKSLDGKVDAFGLGGIDLYLYAGKKRYIIKDAEKIAACAKKTPVVDGSGLKNTLERRVLKYLKSTNWEFKNKNVLMVCALDRFGMTQTFEEFGSNMVYGDLMFSLGIPIKIDNINVLYRLAEILMPVVKHLPFKFIYPTGSKQNQHKLKYAKVFQWADIIAGDFHYIKKHMPKNLQGKMIITNTVTTKDVEFLNKAGVDTLVTTTPELNGRSFGTNVMEGVLVALSGQFPLSEEQYEELLDKVDFKPRVLKFKADQLGRELAHG
ncbi:quinate 5-dehydrogenase [Anaerobranca gottschalkii]|uniref:Quinate 5-dehydrogenase n=1 Tax=Anaerobranca gottschalkii DSM 13577 TaxID=1120990 RepID=A0A1I0AXF1_9FIRM|nr:quinate 5-dehydrogenase [Anaerobranca gottschalkii]SES99056.1 hypothetical protein SAMN03080614_102821 [Anaerobranca gottschalkii DSM 13577]